MTNDLTLIRKNFTDIPLVIGEYAASAKQTEPAARWKWYDHIIRTAKSLNTTTFLWDNGDDGFLNHRKGTWGDKTALEIILNAQKGVANSLPDSTTDDKAERQTSSAFIWQKVGDEVKDQSLPFLMNGNTVKSISYEGKDLATPADYAVQGSSITFKKEFLSKHVSKTGAPGVKGEVTVTFSAGAASRLKLIQWNVPKLKAASSKAVKGADLEIPIEWNGLPQPAAVKATFEGGEYLADDWTKWRGKLEAGYSTFNKHWQWKENSVVLTKDAVNLVAAKGKKAVFGFEFFPRGPDNVVNYTLTV